MGLMTLLFNFDGRINRAKYWLAVLIWFGVWIVAGILLFISNFFVVFIVLAVIVFIASFISSLAVGVRRLHDRNKSGWWLLLFYIVPAVPMDLDEWRARPA